MSLPEKRAIAYKNQENPARRNRGPGLSVVRRAFDGFRRRGLRKQPRLAAGIAPTAAAKAAHTYSHNRSQITSIFSRPDIALDARPLALPSRREDHVSAAGL